MDKMGEGGVHLIGPVVCRPDSGISRGIWHNGNPLDHPYTIFLMQMFGMGLVSQLIYYVLRPLKQPKFVCYALSGIFVGPHLMGRSSNVLESANYYPTENICVRVAAFLGGIYLLFIVAVKVEFSNVRRALANVSIIGFTSIFCCFSTVLALSFVVQLPGFPKEKWLHAMFAFLQSLTRLSSLVYSFDELNIMTSELAQLAMSTSLLSEFLNAVVLLIDLSQRHSKHVEGAVLGCLLFVLLMVYAVRPILMWIIRRTPDGKRVSEVYVVLILVGVLAGAFVADAIGSVHIGVIVMGLIVPNGPPLGSILIEKAEFFVLEILLPMMYMSMGYDTDLNSIDFRTLTKFLTMILIGIAAKTVGTFLSAMARGIDSRQALLLGLMLNIKGPFDIIPFFHWKAHKMINNGLFASLVLSQLIVTAIAAPIIEKLYDSTVRMNISEVKKNMRAIQSTPADRELRIVCCVYGEEHVPGLINLLHITNVPMGRLCAYIVQVTELTGRAIPSIEPHSQTSNLNKNTSRKMNQVMQAFENNLKPIKSGTLVVKAYNVMAPYKSMHEYICKLALDEQTPLIVVPFPDATQQFELAEANALRNGNNNVQINAPCTVGILVDRSARFSMNSFTTHRKVAVIFFGGADDREALSLGTRISSHPTVSVTVFRLIPLKRNNHDLEDRIEEKLDQQVINEFKVKNAYNFRTLYYESFVSDAEQAMDAMRPLENKYNLIIVGCEGKWSTSMFHEIVQWSENPELGVVGDFLASPDFSNGMTSVLVMRHHYGDAKGAVPFNNGAGDINVPPFHSV